MSPVLINAVNVIRTSTVFSEYLASGSTGSKSIFGEKSVCPRRVGGLSPLQRITDHIRLQRKHACLLNLYRYWFQTWLSFLLNKSKVKVMTKFYEMDSTMVYAMVYDKWCGHYKCGRKGLGRIDLENNNLSVSRANKDSIDSLHFIWLSAIQVINTAFQWHFSIKSIWLLRKLKPTFAIFFSQQL